jgi:hypothetical protein
MYGQELVAEAERRSKLMNSLRMSAKVASYAGGLT